MASYPRNVIDVGALKNMPPAHLVQQQIKAEIKRDRLVIYNSDPAGFNAIIAEVPNDVIPSDILRMITAAVAHGYRQAQLDMQRQLGMC